MNRTSVKGLKIAKIYDERKIKESRKDFNATYIVFRTVTEYEGKKTDMITIKVEFGDENEYSFETFADEIEKNWKL